MYTSVLVPIDGSKIAETVLPYARFIADKFKLPVELLAALDIGELGTHISVGQSRFLSTLVEDSMQNSEAYLKRIAHTFHEADMKRTVDKGPAAEVIIDKGAADTGMLIAMATHGRSGVNRRLLGSIAEKVLRATANPLLLVRVTDNARTEGEAPLKSIIVPLDGSELAESVLPMVAGMVNKLDLAVILFRGYNAPYSVYGYGYGYYAIDVQKVTAEMRNDADGCLEKKAAEIKKLGVAMISCVTKEGIGADEIINVAREAPHSLITMCSHGRSGVKRWALGSMTESVVRHADIPVLVLRPAITGQG